MTTSVFDFYYKENSLTNQDCIIHWNMEIIPPTNVFALYLKDLCRYRWLLVRRDLVTILGPLWFFIQSIFATITFTINFSKLTKTENKVEPNLYILFPVIIILLAILDIGLVITALTTKYRNWAFVVTFGIQLMMYATPVIYLLSATSTNYRILIAINLMGGLIETFRYVFIGPIQLYPAAFFCGVVVSIFIFLTGLIIFNKVEKNFIDTI